MHGITAGLSPLARGNRLQHRERIRAVGPIPARAGQPPKACVLANLHRAYPRSRGATSLAASSTAPVVGLSPLARGNLRGRQSAGHRLRPIPARAGQPPSGHRPRLGWGAYPRSRGATPFGRLSHFARLGLSPLARGNLAGWLVGGRGVGPIPARAGQPTALLCSCLSERAYPRSRGATDLDKGKGDEVKGLSPLARGNPALWCGRRSSSGPIPARAGQPLRHRGGERGQGAYPRSRGATFHRRNGAQLAQGLSPLARGNLAFGFPCFAVAGPIPARAGQPHATRPTSNQSRAYPRSRGATGHGDILIGEYKGLSPLARGNQGHEAKRNRREGPIPARAGQPRARRQAQCLLWAYPRSRGATQCVAHERPQGLGLSPLARGNHSGRQCQNRAAGPIPARAGQPFPPRK